MIELNLEINRFNHKYLIFYIILFISYILAIINLFYLQSSVPIGYVIDIYRQLPDVFWYLSIIIYFICCLSILQKIQILRYAGNVLLLINFSTILLVPYKLGYYNYGSADELSHIGEISHIILSSHVDKLNIYPLTHIIYANSSLICQIPVNVTSLLFPVYFSIMFAVGMVIFTRSITPTYKELHYVIIPFCFIYYLGHFHLSNIPYYTFFAVLPIFLFVLIKYFQNRSTSLSIVITIFLIVFPFAHPFIFMFILYILILAKLEDFILNKKSNIQKLITISLITYLAWATYNASIMVRFSTLVGLIGNKLARPIVFMGGLDTLRQSDMSLAEIFNLIFYYYVRYLIPVLFISIFILFFIINRKLFNKNNQVDISKSIKLFLIFVSFELFLFLNPIIVHNFDRISNLNLAIFGIIPLFAISFYHFILNHEMKPICFLVGAILLSLIFASATYGVFFSPRIYHPNIGVPNNEVLGMSWLFTHKSQVPIKDLVGSIGPRYADLFFGWSESEKRVSEDLLRQQYASTPDHFGYDTSNHYLSKSSYIVLTTMAEEMYQTLFSRLDKYNGEDFYKFRNDFLIKKIYDSLNIAIYIS